MYITDKKFGSRFGFQINWIIDTSNFVFSNSKILSEQYFIIDKKIWNYLLQKFPNLIN